MVKLYTAYRIITYPIRKLIFIFRIKFSRRTSNVQHLQNFQASAFRDESLSRQDGLNVLRIACRNVLSVEYDETVGMFSEHLVLLCAIAYKRGGDIKNILEIGTFDGQTSALLSSIFPNAYIDTIDLPSNSNQFINSYSRAESIDEFVNRRDTLIKKSNRIRFIPTNSLQLINWPNDSYDIIWVDGAHGSPIVCCDLINAFRLARFNAIVMVDDVWVEAVNNDQMYKGIAAFETLECLREAGLINDYKLFLKRISPEFNISGRKKYIGFFVKGNK